MLPSKLQKVEVILKIGIVLRLPFAQGSFLEENLTIIKLPNAPTRQAYCYWGIQQSYEALKSSQTKNSLLEINIGELTCRPIVTFCHVTQRAKYSTDFKWVDSHKKACGA